jgi:hypothetical protein
MNIIRRPQSLILVKENNVRTRNLLLMQKSTIRSTEYARGSTDFRMHPEILQNHNGRRTIFDFIQCYSSKLHLTSCFTLSQCSENIQQFAKFLSHNIFLSPFRVCNYILELIQISITKMQYIIMYCCSQKPQTCLRSSSG